MFKPLAVAAALFAAATAIAEGPAQGRLLLSIGAAQRNSLQQDGALPIRVEGFAPSQLRLSAAYYFDRSPLGVALEGAGEWYNVVGSDLGGKRVQLPATGFRGSLAVGGRWLLREGLCAEGHLGYLLGQVPAVGISATGTNISPLRHHGPMLAAVLGYDMGGLLALSLEARAAPIALGASASGVGVRFAQYRLGAEVSVGNFEAAGLRFAALADYELSSTSAARAQRTLSQTSHRVGLGLRAKLPGAARPVAAVAPPVVAAPPPVVAPPPPPPKPAGPGAIRGVARVADPAGPAADLPVEAAGAAAVRTGPDGSFFIQGVGPGPVAVKVNAPGFQPAEELVSVPPGAEATLELVLHKIGVQKQLATFRGLIRSTSGEPVQAKVTIREAKATTRAGAAGRFVLRVPGGQYTVVIEAPGFVTQTRVVLIDDGDQAIFHCDLKRSGR